MVCAQLSAQLAPSPDPGLKASAHHEFLMPFTETNGHSTKPCCVARGWT